MTEDEEDAIMDLMFEVQGGEHGHAALARLEEAQRLHRHAFLPIALRAIRGEPPPAPAPPPVAAPPQTDEQIIAEAREGRYGPRIANLIAHGHMPIEQLRERIAQIIRPGISHAEAPLVVESSSEGGR